jgi:hypothetical protein
MDGNKVGFEIEAHMGASMLHEVQNLKRTKD